MTILLVDDSDTSRAWMRSTLRSSAAIIEADGVHEAIKAFSPAVSLVVTDYEMPGLLGTELARRIRAAGSKVPIIMVSSHMVEREALKAGCNAFVVKGDAIELRKVAKRLLGGSR
jgi:CheY-like chemotaxis protein